MGVPSCSVPNVVTSVIDELIANGLVAPEYKDDATKSLDEELKRYSKALASLIGQRAVRQSVCAA